MKSLLLVACVLGTALCAPKQTYKQTYMEFDFDHAPVEAIQAVPAGTPIRTLKVILPVDAHRQPAAGPVRGFVKQEIPQPNGRESLEVLYPFGYDQSAPAAPVVPVVPVAPVAPVVPVAPVAPVAPAAAVLPIINVIVPAAKRKDEDDEDDE